MIEKELRETIEETFPGTWSRKVNTFAKWDQVSPYPPSRIPAPGWCLLLGTRGERRGVNGGGQDGKEKKKKKGGQGRRSSFFSRELKKPASFRSPLPPTLHTPFPAPSPLSLPTPTSWE